jgi:hypothetical protein
MLIMPMVATLCASGIAFYIRFLVALCKECKPRRIGYWARLQLGSSEGAISERQEQRGPVTRVA